MTSASWIEKVGDDPEALLCVAKISELLERWNDMSEAIKLLISKKTKLTDDERNLFSVANKNHLGKMRWAYRVINNKTKSGAERPVDVALTNQIIKELEDNCSSVLETVDKLLQLEDDHSARVFYLKMKGDYNRYRAEVRTGESRDEAVNLSRDGYALATEAAKSLSVTNPIKLGLDLNHSVFYYEILEEPVKACKIARDALDAALEGMDSAPEESSSDGNLIMQLIKENLHFWDSEVEGQGQPVDGTKN